MTKVLGAAVMLAVVCTASLPSAARDEQKLFPIRQALSSPDAKSKLDPGIRLYFGKQGHPVVTRDHGEWKSNKKSNAFARPDQQACEWAFLSAVISLQERARKEGANAVVGILSNYKNVPRGSETEYVCGAGGLMAGVALKGKVVNLGGR